MVTQGLEDVAVDVDQYLQRVPGYAEGSARTEAIHPGPGGPSAIVRYVGNDRILGRVSCVMVAPLGAEADSPPRAGGGCVPLAGVSANQLVGMSYQSEGVEPYLLIRHSPDAETVVVELADGEFFVIRPNGSTVSYRSMDRRGTGRRHRLLVRWLDHVRGPVWIAIGRLR